MKYLDSATVERTKRTKAPMNPSKTGYGKKIPSQWMLRINRRWHRVYIVQYYNVGSAYVLIRGEAHYLQQSLIVE